jgi:hypothetical protein
MPWLWPFYVLGSEFHALLQYVRNRGLMIITWSLHLYCRNQTLLLRTQCVSFNMWKMLTKSQPSGMRVTCRCQLHKPKYHCETNRRYTLSFPAILISTDPTPTAFPQLRCASLISSSPYTALIGTSIFPSPSNSNSAFKSGRKLA